MKKLAILSLFAVLLGTNEISAQEMTLHAGYDTRYEAVYGGVGYMVTPKVMLSGEYGMGGDNRIAKLGLIVEAVEFSEAYTSILVGAAGGYTFPTENSTFYNDVLVDVSAGLRWRDLYAMYSFALYAPGNPNLSGFGSYHYVRVGWYIQL